MSKVDVLKGVQTAIEMAKSGQMGQAKAQLVHLIREQNAGDAAELAARTLVSISADDYEALYEASGVFLNNAKLEDAFTVTERILALKPNYVPALNAKGNILKRAGQLPEAQQVYETALEYAEDKEQKITVAINMLYILLDRQMYDEIIEQGLEYEKLMPDSLSLHSVMANAYWLRDEDEEKALEHLQKAIKADPKSMSPYYELARLYYETDEKKTRMYWQKAKDICAEGAPKVVSPRDWEFMDYHARTGKSERDHNTHEIPMGNIDDYLETSEYFEIVDQGPDDDDYILKFSDDFTFFPESWEIWRDDILFANLTFIFQDARTYWLHGYRFDKATLPNEFKTETLEEPVLLIGGEKNYYHWWVDYLPRLKMVLDKPEYSNIPLIFGSNLTGFQKDSLSLLGIDESRILGIDGQTAYQCKNLMFCHFKGRPYETKGLPDTCTPTVRPEVTNWLREKFKDHMVPRDDFPKRIFISRQGALMRRCTNEDDVFALAQNYGFEKVANETLSLSDQMALYAGAEVVMGVHGAGFTNMLFSNEGAHLIELMSQHNLPDFYVDIASVLKQKHTFIPGLITRLNSPSKLLRDFEVDIEDVKKVLESL